MPFTVVIPARLQSSRLPAKVLAQIAGKPMVVRVAERARESGARRVIVATDHPDVARAVEEHGFEALMTAAAHATGTDRIAEAVERLGLAPRDLVVNVQGDEPLVEPGLIRAVAELLAATPEAAIATACHPVRDAAEFFNPNVVKVVLDHAGFARYFSRAPVPWARDAFAASSAALPEGLPGLRHIGVYAYRVEFQPKLKRALVHLEKAEEEEKPLKKWTGKQGPKSLREGLSKALKDRTK